MQINMYNKIITVSIVGLVIFDAIAFSAQSDEEISRQSTPKTDFYSLSVGICRSPKTVLSKQEIEKSDYDEPVNLDILSPILSDQTKSAANTTIQRVHCSKRLNSSDSNIVQLVDDSALQKILKHENSSLKHDNSSSHNDSSDGICQALLLYAPWCPFSARFSPHYNALGRAFPDVELLAINAVTLNYWNAKFGTVAVPDMLLFHNGRFVAKFNHTEKNLETLTWFIQNYTTLEAIENVIVSESDYEGPIPVEPVKQADYYLYLSWAVICIAVIHISIKFNTYIMIAYHRVTDLFHYDPPHQD